MPLMYSDKILASESSVLLSNDPIRIPFGIPLITRQEARESFTVAAATPVRYEIQIGK